MPASTPAASGAAATARRTPIARQQRRPCRVLLRWVRPSFVRQCERGDRRRFGVCLSSKFTGGVQIGHNWQTGNFVYGVEGDFGAFNIRGSRSGSGVYPAGTLVAGFPGSAFTVTNSVSTDWLLTVRGRIGWAASGWLVYATGGLAMSRVEVENSFSDANAQNGVAGATGSSSYSKVKFGWTVGGGMEVAVTRNRSLKGEYLYADLGSVSTVTNITHLNFVGYTNALGVSTSLTAHVARLGANYRF